MKNLNYFCRKKNAQKIKKGAEEKKMIDMEDKLYEKSNFRGFKEKIKTI